MGQTVIITNRSTDTMRRFLNSLAIYVAGLNLYIPLYSKNIDSFADCDLFLRVDFYDGWYMHSRKVNAYYVDATSFVTFGVHAFPQFLFDFIS